MDKSRSPNIEFGGVIVEKTETYFAKDFIEGESGAEDWAPVDTPKEETEDLIKEEIELSDLESDLPEEESSPSAEAENNCLVRLPVEPCNQKQDSSEDSENESDEVMACKDDPNANRKEYENKGTGYKNLSTRKSLYLCQHCGSTYNRESRYRRHLIIHTGEKPFKCEKCEERFGSRYAINYHLLKIHSDMPVSRVSICEFCGHKSHHIGKHLNKAHPDKRHFCRKCEKGYSSAAKLEHHKCIPSYNCANCSKTFKNKSKLKTHMTIHTGVKAYQCKYCSKEFRCYLNHYMHLRVHLNDKRYECRYCHKKFVIKSVLTKHLRVHTGEKPFSCQLCPTRFTQDQSLKRHLLIHSGEKPFECPHCPKKFNQKQMLQSHMLTHTGERPFKCEHCCKDFNNKQTLKSHTLTHSVKKSLQCDDCGKKFAQKRSLIKHKCASRDS